MKRFLLFIALLSCSPGLLQAQDFENIAGQIHEGQEDEAIAALKKIDQPNNIRSLNLLGEAYLRKGLYEEALQNLEKAEYLQETNPEHDNLQLAGTYSLIALLHYATGNNQLSLQYHFKALDLRQVAKDDIGVAATNNDIGLVYSKPNPAKALTYYERALEDYLKIYGQKDERIVSGYLNIGFAHSNLGDYPAAHKNFDMALEIRQQLGRSTVQEAFLHSSIGVVYSREERLDEALQEFDLALGIYRKIYGSKHPEIASTYYLMGNTFHSMGKFNEALHNYQQALVANVADFEAQDFYLNPALENYYSADVLLRTLYEKAKTFEDLHNSFSLKIRDLETAYNTIGLCDGLIDKIRQFRNSEADKVALGALADEVYAAAIRISVNMAEISWKKGPYYEKAFQYSDKSKSAVLLEAIADANAKSFAGIPDDLLEQERLFKAQVAYYEQKLAGKPTPEEEVLYRKELFDWTKNYNDLIASLEELFPTYFNLKHNAQAPDIATIRRQLGENEAMLSYFVAAEDELIYAFIITKKKLQVKEIPLDAKYESNISGYRNAMYYDAPNTYKKTARALYNQLMAFRLPGNIKKLIIVPSGRMATIPFESLITRDFDVITTPFMNIPYLIKQYSISYFYAASLFLNPKVEMTPEQTVTLFAPVEFKGRRLSTLPGTASEVKEIGSLFDESSAAVSFYLEDKATVSQVKSEMVQNSKYLHFATHGIVDEKRPERSQICMATEDGVLGSLYSGDIYGLNLSADLVVLSACETGLGKISKGEGIIGLTRALIYAGSNNLVVSLWRVNDASTSSLMRDFYASMLLENGYAEALRMAKLKMIGTKQYSSPYYWATFVLIGE
jgi:CHAT domain-containing protein/Tfp pilus assembly protein PilF